MAHRAFFVLAALAALLVGENAFGQEVGSIRGIVLDEDFDAPLALARVTIAETGESVTASESGEYIFARVEPGTYTLVVSKEGYTSERVQVVVTAGQVTEMNVSLSGEFTDMDEFVVRDVQLGGATEIGLLRLRRESPALVDSVGSELMSLAGAGDAAAALRLVSGTTVSEGKYAVIRGLPDRFVVSQLNGVRLPSAAEETRAAELDQFPSSTIESVQVTKTFTPDQQGDASGGAVNIVLTGIPEKPFFIELGIGTKFNTQTSDRDDFLTYTDGGVNTWGVNGDRNDIPVIGIIPGNPPTRILSDPPAVGVSTKDAPFNYDLDLTVGGRHTFESGVTIGAIGHAYYGRDSELVDDAIDHRWWLANGAVGSDLVAATSRQGDLTSLYDVKRAEESVTWGVLASVGVEIENHELSFVYMQTTNTSDSATFVEDTLGDVLVPDGDPFVTPYRRGETLKYAERTTKTMQLRGRHRVPTPGIGIEDVLEFHSPEIDWTISKNSASSNEPDERFFQSQYVTGGVDAHLALGLFSAAFSGNTSRTWEQITEDSEQYAVNLKIPFDQWSGDKGYIKFGVFADDITRQFEQQTFQNFNQGILPPLFAPFDVSYSEVFLTLPGVQPITDENKLAVDFTGELGISAWYAMADLPLTSNLKLIGGVRFESTKFDIQTFPEADARAILPRTPERLTTPGAIVGATGYFDAFDNRIIDVLSGLPIGDVDFEQDDVLPSLALVFKPIEEVTFRASWSETIARPTFRELSVVARQEYQGSDIFVGNPDLGMVALTNFDLRLDYEPYGGGLVSVSWFKKDLEDPIEYVQDFDTNLGRYTTVINFPSGKLSGFEFEVRQDMGRFWDQLDGLRMGANAAIIDATVMLPESETTLLASKLNGARITERRMVNAPEYLVNFYLTYTIEETDTEIGLFYTLKGDTLVAGEGQDTNNFVPAVFANAYDTLNLTVTQSLGKHFKLKFSAKNLTDPLITEVYRSEYIARDRVKASYRKGIDFSVSVSASFEF